MKPLHLTLSLAVCLFTPGCDGVAELLPYEAAEPPAEWSAMLGAVNALRAEGRTCGGETFGPAEPLAWNGQLGAAAQRHSEDMAEHGHFSHTGTDGSSVGDRASAAGYEWRRVGENIARYQQTVGEVVADWAESPGHCANLMDPNYTEFGAAELDRYWTQVFGHPR